jgi:hypothetical protein
MEAEFASEAAVEDAVEAHAADEAKILLACCSLRPHTLAA